MQTSPGHTTTYHRGITQDASHYRGAEPAPLNPAERIALTIALLNRGLDLLDGLARTSLSVCARGALPSRDGDARARRPKRVSRV